MAVETRLPRLHRSLIGLVQRLDPAIAGLDQRQRLNAASDLLRSLVFLPLALAGVAWLVQQTDLAALRQQWLPLAVFSLLVLIFNRLGYFFVVEIRSGRFGDYSGSFDDMLVWTAALVYGPNALWVAFLVGGVGQVNRLGQPRQASFDWNNLANALLNLSLSTLGYLLPLACYTALGGTFPLPGLELEPFLLGLAATLVRVLCVTLMLGFFIYTGAWLQTLVPHEQYNTRQSLRFFLLSLGMPSVVHLYSILAAGLLASQGWLIFLFYTSGMLLVSLLANRLSRAAERSRQHSNYISRLQQLSRAMLESPADASALPGLLAAHTPDIFPMAQVEIRLFPAGLQDAGAPEGLLLRHPPESAASPALWSWLEQRPPPASLARTASALAREQAPPWNTLPKGASLLITPILDPSTLQPVGAICITWGTLPTAISTGYDLAAAPHLPVQSAAELLAEQISAALLQARLYRQALERQRYQRELELAAQIQMSFLPEALPQLPGWQISACLRPARLASGDFYDAFLLPGGRLALLVADVMDKGMGAALYMALTRTLLRSFLEQPGATPAAVLHSANERILSDARAGQFVTLFLGILDPSNGALDYANAGHNPPLLFSPAAPSPNRLSRTGIPLGIYPDQSWEPRQVSLPPGAALLIYTDGLTEAEAAPGDFYSLERLAAAAQPFAGRGAAALQSALLQSVDAFTAGAPLADDLTLLILSREPQERDAPGPGGVWR